MAALPPIDSLGNASDYKPFMQAGVPQALKLQALRRLWATDPLIGIPDPFEMNSVDYTHLAAPGQIVKTSYQVGKGFVDAVEKLADRLEGVDKPGGSPGGSKKTVAAPVEEEANKKPADPSENRKPKAKA